MSEQKMSTIDKAFQLNMDRAKYGTFAEIGAGQEVCNWFFQAGASSGSVAKTMSAYDMTVSDAIYGECKRYVSRSRLQQMLDHEYSVLVDRLSEKRGNESTFFAFADTVKARAYKGKGECHGWLGVRFQREPMGDPHEIIMHVRLLDETNMDQMQALGIIGVNLLYASFFHTDDVGVFASSLLDGLTRSRVEVDMLKFDGPDFEDRIDNRSCSLHLVESGLTDAAMFNQNGEVLQPAEMLYKKSVLLLRGSFNPVTKVNLDMIASSRKHFEESFEEASIDNVVEIMECTTSNLLQSDGRIDHDDFLKRADNLQKLGKTVLISKFAEFHRLAGYLARYTSAPVGIILGVRLLETVFRENWYKNLEGGILEGMGRLFKDNVKLFVYPAREDDSTLRSVEDARIEHHLRNLYAHLLENGYLVGIEAYCKELMKYTGKDVRCLRDAGDPAWKDFVPPEVLENV